MLLKTAFDIDGVMCHTWQLMLTIFQEKGYDVAEEDMSCFDLKLCLNVPIPVIRQVIDESLDVKNMHRKYVDPEAVLCVSMLHNLTGKTIPFVTSRKEPEDTAYFLDNYVVKGEFPYVVRHGSWTDGKLCSQRKLEQLNELGCVAMVEDAPETLRLLSQHGIISMLRDRPYNKYATWGLRFSDWYDVLNVAIRLEMLC